MYLRNPQIDQKMIDLEAAAKEYNSSAKTQPGTIQFRPDYGTLGISTQMRSNFFRIDLNPDVIFYCYHVEIEPKPQIPRLYREIHYKLLQEKRFVEAKGMSDFMHEIVTCQTIDKTDVVVHLGSGRSESDTFKCKFKEKSKVEHKKIMELLRRPNTRYPIQDEQNLIRVMNILMTAYPFTQRDRVKIVGKGTTKFFPLGSQSRQHYAQLGGGLECGRGFFTSVRLGAGRLLLNLNVCHNSMYLAGPFINMTNQFVQEHGEDRQAFNAFVKSVRVELTHLPKEMIDGQLRYPQKHVWGLASPGDTGGTKTRVARLGSSPSNVQFFENDRSDPSGVKGRWVTVAEYFARSKYSPPYRIWMTWTNILPEYNMTKLERVPVLNVGSNVRPQYIPQDVANILPAQPYNGELTTIQRQNIIKFSCRKPPNNYKSIMEDGRRIVGITDQRTKEYGIVVDSDMVVVPARILPPPNLLYDKKQIRPANGSWNLQGVKFTTGAKFPANWCYVNMRLDSVPEFSDSSRYFDALTKCMQGLGLRMPRAAETRSVKIPSKAQDWRREIESFLQKAKHEKIGLLIIILNGLKEEHFNYLKWWADHHVGILNHCCRLDKFRGKGHPDAQYMANNAMKINLKLGGTCQTLQTVPRLLASGKTMIVGLDVTHSGPGSPFKQPSMAAIVASTGKDLGQWPGDLLAQPVPESENKAKSGNKANENLSKNIRKLLLGRLELWKKINGSYPDKIIIFRDGVSEGQYPEVLCAEIPAVLDTLKVVYKHQQSPNISFILVTKRHHVRFYPTKPLDTDKKSNPKNGTIVDRVVTRPALWDYYLQAQSALQGSARPAHYIVLYDDIFTNKMVNRDGKPSDILQELSHHICYVMGRCTRSISYATPAFLADRLCERGARFQSAYGLQDRDESGSFTPPHNQSRAETPQAERNRKYFRIHQDVKDYMIYI